MVWNVEILTLFPDAFPGILAKSITGRAINDGLCRINAHNLRDFALDNHRTVDDASYGGGEGMVLRCDILGRAIDAVLLQNKNPIIYLSPRGRTLRQEEVRSIVRENRGINLICGRFEGVDQRVLERYSISELSIGDYILSGGDLAAMVLLDACIRLLPGVLQPKAVEEESFAPQDSFLSGLLEYDHYTRPAIWEGRAIPEVLLSGNHAAIAEWRYENALQRTRERRPELLQGLGLAEMSFLPKKALK